QWAGKKGSAAEDQPASRAGGTAGNPRRTSGGAEGTLGKRERRRRRAGRGRALAARRRPAARFAAAGRRSGSTARAPSTSLTSGLGRSGRALASEGAPRPIRLASSRKGPEPNGWRPASASHRSSPADQTSVAGPAVFPASRSGEMYAR